MISLLGDDTTMPVRSVFAKADIGDHDQVWRRLFDRPNGLLHDSVLRVGLEAFSSFCSGIPNSRTALNAELSD